MSEDSSAECNGDAAGEFVPCEGIYLLSHSVGRPPRNAQRALDERFFAPWHAGQGDPWAQWLAGIERFRAALARLLGGGSADYCPQANLSSALGKIVGALPLRRGKEVIVFCEDDFPSLGFVLRQALRAGYKLRCVQRTADPFDLQVWWDALGDDVGLALFTHVQSNTGRRLAIADLLSRCAARDIVSIVDVAQSAGIVPIDVTRWDGDFVIGSSVKWLCGGPGAGWLWANPRIIDVCAPADVGWFSHADPFEFDIHDFRYHAGALRFWGGTPSVVPYVVASAGIELCAQLGIERLHAHNQMLTQMLVDAVQGIDERMLRSPAAPAQRSGTVILDPGARTQRVRTRLDAHAVRYDARAIGLRLSPHIYNSAGDIALVINCLQTQA